MSKVEDRDVNIKTKNGQVHTINASDVSEDERVQHLWEHYSKYIGLRFIKLHDIYGWQSGAKQASSNTIQKYRYTD